jgi:adenylate cyclase
MADNIKDKKPADIEGAKRKNKVLRFGILLTFAVVLMQMFGAFSNVELKTLDWRFQRRGPRTPKLQGAIVAIDDESFNGWSDDKNVYHTMPESWTWPRSYYGVVIDNLREAGAKLIAFDMAFSESKRTHPQEDVDFANAAKRAGNVIFGERYVPKANGAWKTETVITLLDNAKRDKGHVLPVTSEDGELRGYRPMFYNSSFVPDPSKPNLDLAVYRQLIFGKALDPSFDEKTNEVVLGDKRIPLNEEGYLMINYCGGAESFPTFPFHKVFYKDMDMSVFKDRVVYVGSTSGILQDNWPMPFTSLDGNKMPGVETHAHALDTMLSEAWLKQPSAWICYLLILGLGLLTCFGTYRVKPLFGLLVMGLIFGTYLVVNLILFIQQNWVIPMVAPLCSSFLSFAGIAVYRASIEEKLARSTRAMFSRYVSKHIVDEIMKNPGAVKLGGEVKEVSILFSDVRGFTAMSERLSAPEVVEVLNEYLTAMVDIVIANGGTLDKYVGDAIMAVWGSPLADPKHEENAARTAVMMMEVLHELQKKWKAEGKPEIDIGIGINSGHVVAGNMGHPEYKMDYTVIGDDVNLAARLESANKEMKAHVLISGSTYDKVQNLLEVVKHPNIHVKGKEKDVEVYEVLGWKGQRGIWAVPLKG